MTWSQRADNNVSPLFDEIIRHPFILGLIDGTLDKEKFLFYLHQDALYLADYGKVLAGISAKLSKPEHSETFLAFAKETLIVERALHETFLQTTPKSPNSTQSPTCLLYTAYLHKQLTNASVNIAVAAVLPCFWIYKKAGDYILANQQIGQNPYQTWIDTYSSKEFAEAVERAIAICDELAEACTPDQRQAMTAAFITATKLEWMFWDSAWQLEDWPV